MKIANVQVSQFTPKPAYLKAALRQEPVITGCDARLAQAVYLVGIG